VNRDLADATVAIVGLGLMGGSLAAALSARHACNRVVGVARRRVTCETARELRFIDRGTCDLAEGVAEADIVVLAMPVGEILATVPLLGPLLKPGCLVTDVGSTKHAICAALDALPAALQAVGGHPMCGKETSGLSVAEPTLYEGRVYVLCPLARTSPGALGLARSLVEAVGARPVLLEAERHDHAVAAISHLPYTLAVALVNAVSALAASDPACLELAAGGYRDSTRLASSDLQMMRDILMTNREPLLEALHGAQVELGRLEDALCRGDTAALVALLQAAHNHRREMMR